MPEASEPPADDGAGRVAADDTARVAADDTADPGGDGSVPRTDDAGSDRRDGGGDRRGVHNLIRALRVPTQAKRGFAVGILVAVATYWFFVVASGGSPYSSLYLLALAAVLAFTLGLLATLAFTLGAAYRLSRRLE